MNITFSSSQAGSEYFKDITEMAKCGSLNELSFGFFQKLNKLMSHRPVESSKTVIKVNNEPIFP